MGRINTASAFGNKDARPQVKVMHCQILFKFNTMLHCEYWRRDAEWLKSTSGQISKMALVSKLEMASLNRNTGNLAADY